MCRREKSPREHQRTSQRNIFPEIRKILKGRQGIGEQSSVSFSVGRNKVSAVKVREKLLSPVLFHLHIPLQSFHPSVQSEPLR